MGTNKLIDKLDEFFSMPDKKQKKKQEKLLKIIDKLERKQSKVKHEMVLESEKNETSDKFHELDKEYKVLAKLLKKARKNSVSEDDED